MTRSAPMTPDLEYAADRLLVIRSSVWLGARAVFIDPFALHIYIVGGIAPGKEFQDPQSDTVSKCERSAGGDSRIERSIPPISESWPDSGERTGNSQPPRSCGLRQRHVDRLMGSGR